MVLPAGTSTARAIGKLPALECRTISAACAAWAAWAAIMASTTVAAALSRNFWSWDMRIPLEGIDVRHHVGDGLVVRQGGADRAHLRTRGVALVGATQTPLVVAQLRDQVPVRARGQRGRLQLGIALGLVPMASGASLVELLAM